MLLTAHKGQPLPECLDVDAGEKLSERSILLLTACLAAAVLTLWVSHAAWRLSRKWASQAVHVWGMNH